MVVGTPYLFRHCVTGAVCTGVVVSMKTWRAGQVTFGDIWCRFVSVSPAPHIYWRGERVSELVRTFTAAIRRAG